MTRLPNPLQASAILGDVARRRRVPPPAPTNNTAIKLTSAAAVLHTNNAHGEGKRDES